MVLLRAHSHTITIVSSGAQMCWRCCVYLGSAGAVLGHVFCNAAAHAPAPFFVQVPAISRLLYNCNMLDRLQCCVDALYVVQVASAMDVTAARLYRAVKAFRSDNHG
jgi:hypothetical protein